MSAASVLAARPRLRSTGFVLLLVAVLSPFLAFFAYMVATSFQDPLTITSPGVSLWFTPTLDNYRQVLFTTDFLLFTVNSLTVAVGSVGIALVLGLPAAFAIAKLGAPRVAVVILSSRITPGITFLVPWFILFSQAGWVDTYQALVLSHLLVTLPMVTWLMISFFEEVPDELLDSAAVDGAGIGLAFLRVVLPLTRAGIAAAGILGFVFSWNHFMFSVVIAGRTTRTLPVAVFEFMSYGQLNWGAIAAAATLMTLPVFLIAVPVQRHIVSGLAGGAVKG